MSNAENKCLFLFTKLFPFGNGEQYLVDELPFLAEQFQRIVVVPCELFDHTGKEKRELPDVCEVLLLNDLAKSYTTPKKWYQVVSQFTLEFIRCRNKRWFMHERRRYWAVLRYQLHLSFVLEDILSKHYRSYQCTFYAYWIHNASIMLGWMKMRGAIRNFICRGHSIDLYEWDWALTRYIKILPFYHFNVHWATRIYAISEHGKQYLQHRFPKQKEKFYCSRLGVIEGGSNPFHDEDEFTIVSCSNFSENKNVKKIAEVVSLLRGNVRWLHFGAGSALEMDAVKAIIKTSKSSVKAELCGFTPNAELRNFYSSRQVNLFINLSEAEGIPVSMMEAISFGIPVLGSAVYGNPEVANEHTGFSVSYEETAVAIADRISEFRQNIELQRRLRSSAAHYYREHFAAAVNYRHFSNEIANL